MTGIGFDFVSKGKNFRLFLDNELMGQKKLKNLELEDGEREIKIVSAFALRSRFWVLMVLLDFIFTIIGGIKFGEWFKEEGYIALDFKCKFHSGKDGYIRFNVDIDRAEPVMVESNLNFEILQMATAEDLALKKRINNYPKIAISILVGFVSVIFSIILIALLLKNVS